MTLGWATLLCPSMPVPAPKQPKSLLNNFLLFYFVQNFSEATQQSSISVVIVFYSNHKQKPIPNHSDLLYALEVVTQGLHIITSSITSLITSFIYYFIITSILRLTVITQNSPSLKGRLKGFQVLSGVVYTISRGIA